MRAQKGGIVSNQCALSISAHYGANSGTNLEKVNIMTTLTLIPAYGRDYKSKKALLADWNANKDFQIATFGPDCGRYINKADADGLRINIRYSKLTKIAMVQS
jgi:hypothetical protein